MLGMRVLLPVVVALAACGPDAKQPDPAAEDMATTEVDVTALGILRGELAAAVKAGDASAVAALYTEGAVLMPPYERPATGKRAIEAWFQANFDQSTAELALLALEVQVAGDRAFERGTYREKLTPKAGGEPTQDDGKYMVILQKQAEGSWKLALDIWNSDNPLPDTEQQSKMETAQRLRAEVTQLRQQIRRLRASQPTDSSQTKLVEALRVRLADQQKQIERLREERCKNCPVPPPPPRGIYLWDGLPPEPVELPLQQVRR